MKYVVVGISESSDEFDPVIFNKKPTNKQLREYIRNTGEELDCDGCADFGSYVYLKVFKVSDPI